MKENVLIITSAGGGGLLQTANAKEQEIKHQNPEARIIKKDLMLEWVRIPFGAWAVKKWDKGQREGNYAPLTFFAKAQPISEVVFWPQIFFNVLKVLFKEDIDRIIDTHPVGTSATIKALRYYNKKRKKNVILEKVVVDLPTTSATHFFRPIKRLKPKDRKHVKLITIDPLLSLKQTKEEFWKENCGLSKDQVVYQYYPIRQVFKKYQNLAIEKDPITISVRTHSLEERSMTRTALSKACMKSKEEKETHLVTIDPKDSLFTILLGSQPAMDATLQYIRKIAELAKDSSKKKNYIIFVFCSYHNENKLSLFQRVYEEALREDLPSNVSILPLSFQKEDVIAPVFHRSNVTFTRSGGQTAMELLGVMKGQIFIHSEAKKTDRTSLLKGIYGWESGSAIYLEYKKGAKIVTPQIFDQFVLEMF